MNLRQKLNLVMAECGHVLKDGYNAFHKYPYVTAAKIRDMTNASCTKHGIQPVPNTELLDIREVETGGGKKERITTIKKTIELRDCDSDEVVTISGIGQGQDAGDKGAAKAETMALKYAWISALLICDASDDPDSDGGEFVRVETPGARPKPAAKVIAGKCASCGREIKDFVAEYSKKNYGRPLCYDCQKKKPEAAPTVAPF